MFPFFAMKRNKNKEQFFYKTNALEEYGYSLQEILDHRSNRKHESLRTLVIKTDMPRKVKINVLLENEYTLRQVLECHV